MSKGKFKAILFFVLFFLVVALVIALLLELQGEKNRTDPAPTAVTVTAAPTAFPTAAPAPSQTPVPSAVPTAVPTAAPAPVPSQEPIPEPTVKPVPAGTVIGSGEFMSDTGVELNVRAVWTAYTYDDSHIRVVVEVYLDSYSLHITAASDSVMVSVGESYKTGDSPTVHTDDNVKISTLLCTTEHIVELRSGENKAIPVQVVYNFGGEYMKKELPTIECGGPIGVSY